MQYIRHLPHLFGTDFVVNLAKFQLCYRPIVFHSCSVWCADDNL